MRKEYSFSLLMSRMIFLMAFLLLPQGAWGQTTVYLTKEEALKLIFPSAAFVNEQKILSEEQKGIAEKLIKSKLSKETWEFIVAKIGGQIAGYALIDNQIGKTEPITFLTAITPKGGVKAVEILVYRESHGSAVHEKPFVNQFAGKTIDQPFKLEQDIKNITGATLSAKAVTKGVKRALALWRIFYGN